MSQTGLNVLWGLAVAGTCMAGFLPTGTIQSEVVWAATSLVTLLVVAANLHARFLSRAALPSAEELDADMKTLEEGDGYPTDVKVVLSLWAMSSFFIQEEHDRRSGRITMGGPALPYLACLMATNNLSRGVIPFLSLVTTVCTLTYTIIRIVQAVAPKKQDAKPKYFDVDITIESMVTAYRVLGSMPFGQYCTTMCLDAMSEFIETWNGLAEAGPLPVDKTVCVRPDGKIMSLATKLIWAKKAGYVSASFDRPPSVPIDLYVLKAGTQLNTIRRGDVVELLDGVTSRVWPFARDAYLAGGKFDAAYECLEWPLDRLVVEPQ